jgi:hypothetical protein
MFGQKQTLMLYLFTATSNTWRELCMTFWLGLTSYPHGSVHRFTRCFWRKCYQNCWRKSPCHSGETMVPARRGCGSFLSSALRTSHRHLQRSLDWTGQVCGLASQVTGPHTIGLLPLGLHEKLDLVITSWFRRGSYCPYRLCSSNHQAETWHFWAHTSISAVSSALYCGQWPYV